MLSIFNEYYTRYFGWAHYGDLLGGGKGHSASFAMPPATNGWGDGDHFYGDGVGDGGFDFDYSTNYDSAYLSWSLVWCSEGSLEDIVTNFDAKWRQNG